MSSFVKVSTGGSHRDMGVDFGRAAKDILLAFIEDSCKAYPRSAKMTIEDAKRHAAKYFLPTVRRRYPKYLEEVRGIAEGAGLHLDDIFFLTADEEIMALRRAPEKCSSAAIRVGQRTYLGHNEDYPKRYLSRLIVVEAHPNDAPAFLALTYPYVLAGPVCGLNAAGMAFAANSLNFPPRQKGMPTNFVLRDVYRSRRLADVRRAMHVPRPLMGNALMAVSDIERAASVIEASLDDVAVVTMGANGLLAHANHVVSGTLDRTGEKPTRNSRSRGAALELLLAASKQRTADGLKKALSSVKYGLRKIAARKSDSCTLATAILDPNRGMMYVAKRGSGGHGFMAYRLGHRKYIR